jgi:hypothetical protein
LTFQQFEDHRSGRPVAKHLPSSPAPQRESTNFKEIQLNILLDTDDVLRVGSRLKHSNLPFEFNGHGNAGAQAIMAIVRKMFWPLGAKKLVKRNTNGCVIASQWMSDFKIQNIFPSSWTPS